MFPATLLVPKMKTSLNGDPLMKAAWFREWEEFMATFHIPNTTENFLDFMLHFDVADRSKLRKWHRSRYSVDEETAAYNALSAA